MTGNGGDNTANCNNGYSAGRTQGRSDVTNSPNSYSLYTKAQYDANYTSGYNAGVAAAKKNLQVRAKAHVSEGRQYFYVRVYNTSGWGLMFDNGGNDTLAKDGSGYMTIGTFSA